MNGKRINTSFGGSAFKGLGKISRKCIFPDCHET